MRRPCATTSRVAVRRKWWTGCAQRSTSSAASAASDGSAASRVASSGCSSSASRPRLIVWRVVSFPAVVSRMKKTPNSRSSSRDPSTSASTSLVVMSSRGSAAAPRRGAGRTRSAPARTGSRTGACGAPGSCSARSSTNSSPMISGSVLPRILSPSSISRRRSSTGRPMISENTHIGISEATSSTQSNSLALERLREDASRESPDPLLVRVDDAGCEALVHDSAQTGVRRRIRVDHRLSRLDLLRRQVLERRAAELGGVRLPVLGHRHDVVVARERPEAVAAAPRPASAGALRAGAGRTTREALAAPTRRGR